MSVVTQITNLFRRRRLKEELDEELQSHIEEAIERGRPAEEVRRAFGAALRHREEIWDIKVTPWLDALRSDIIFGWRQLSKHRTASAAAVLSLALAMGAATAAFRLVDALLLRTLPVSEPDHLYYLTSTYIDRDGHPDDRDDFDYPTFRRYREAVGERADLAVVGINSRRDVLFGSAQVPEKAYQQYISGNLFNVFGLHPVLGRLIAPFDDLKPGASPVAVLSFDYWTHRFAGNPNVVGQTFRLGNDRFEIVGVAPRGFTGTEPGAVTDIFLPAMMNTRAIDSPGWSWFRIWVRPRGWVSPEQVGQPIQAVFTQDHRDKLKNFHSDTPRSTIEAYLSERILLLPAAMGASRLQKDYRRPLIILGVLVSLVLLIACANVGNLLTARAAARSREMALRVSIGAGQWRLIQLVLVESAMLAVAASVLGLFFAWWSAPFVVSMLHVPEDPVRLVLDPGWRVLLFSALLSLSVTLLFGLTPALRALSVKPMSALKGGDDPHSNRRLMNGLLAAQVAFCVLVQFIAALFVGTFERLSHLPLGFAPERVLIMDTSATAKAQPAEIWQQVASRLREKSGVEAVSFAGWPLMSLNRWTGSVRIPGRAADLRPPYLLDVSPGFFETMHLARIGGRDFRAGDAAPEATTPGQINAGVGIVNQAFARTYFNGRDPVGKVVSLLRGKDTPAPLEIVGLVNDAVYASMREPVRPTIYLPMADRNHNTFIIRTAGDPHMLAPLLRRKVSQARADFRVDTIEFQTDFVRWQMLRERLLAALSMFFSGLALSLAAVGLYGILNYSVARKRREIGIRMALGASSAQVVRRVVSDMTVMVILGSVAGLAAGLAGARMIESLLFEVKPTDAGIVTLPVALLFGAALLAAFPPAIRAVRIDPAETLRNE